MPAEPVAPAMPPVLAAALVAALGELDDVVKGRTAAAGQYTYRYAGLGDVLGATRPVLARHGLALCQYVDVQPATDRGVTVAVHTRLVHVSGHVLEVPALAIAAAATAQAIGSAATYGRRYQAMAVLGVAGDDDDGAEATRTAPAQSAATVGTGSAPARPPAAAAAHEAPRREATGRTVAEAAIFEILDSVDADIAQRVKDGFREHFGSRLADLAVDRHADALDYVTTRLEAELAHDAAEHPDPSNTTEGTPT